MMNLDESLNAVVAKFFYVYQSIPIESFKSSITYESLVDESFIGKVHSEEFPLAAKMSFVRKSDADNEFVGFYPVFFYDTQTIGLSGRYYNTQKGIYKNIGPAHDSDEFVKCLEMLNNDKEKDIYDYVTYSMRIDSGFLMTYQDAVSNFNEMLKTYPKLPLMRCMDDAEHLGTKLEIAVEYVINPYVFSGIAVKTYSLSEESGSVKKHHRRSIRINKSIKVRILIQKSGNFLFRQVLQLFQFARSIPWYGTPYRAGIFQKIPFIIFGCIARQSGKCSIVSPCGFTHNSNSIRIDMKILCMSPDIADTGFDILQSHREMCASVDTVIHSCNRIPVFDIIDQFGHPDINILFDKRTTGNPENQRICFVFIICIMAARFHQRKIQLTISAFTPVLALPVTDTICLQYNLIFDVNMKLFFHSESP